MKRRRILLWLMVCTILCLAACSAQTGNEKQLCADALEQLGRTSEVYFSSTTLVGEDPEQMETSTIAEYWISGSDWASCIRPYGGTGTHQLFLKGEAFTMQGDDGLWQPVETADKGSCIPSVDLEQWEVTGTETKDGMTVITMTAEHESTGKVTYSDYRQVFWLDDNGALRKYEVSLCTTVPQRDGSNRTIYTKTTMQYPVLAPGEMAAFLQSLYEEATTPPPTEPPETTAPPETEPPIELLFPEDLKLTVPENLPEEFGTTPLELQEWFFDFAVDYRVDYMTVFTEEEGAPTDSWEYLYWVATIHEGAYHSYEDPMTAGIVEEIASRYFDVSVMDHRSHFKSWSYDPETGIYTAYPEGGRSYPLTVLQDMDYDPETQIVTVYAVIYEPDRHYDDLEVPALRQELLYGDAANLEIRYQIILKFRLDPETQEPLFLAHEQLDIMYP